MARKDNDSLDQAETRGGSFADAPSKSIGDASTFGDGAESLADDILGGDDFDAGMEVVDLSGRYVIEEVIGQGGMGQVLKAVDTRLKRPVAIKRVLGKLAGSRKALQRFLTEAQSVAALNHFNIVQVHDYGRDKDGPFLILEYVDGVSLSQRLKDGPLELQDAVEMTTQLSAALAAAHRRGIVHRDVKPANVLLTEDGIPKLTDFGLARHESQQGENTRTGAVLGTPDFMAPEQREDSTRADAFSDQWSLAATFYQMVTGESPRIINGDSLPVSVKHVVLRALKTKPSKRYPTLQEFCDELQTAASKQQAASFDVLQLQGGQCGSCGEINDTSRKFCRDCGDSLETACLGCGENELVWERFCGHCGTNTREIVERDLKEVEELQTEIPILIQDYRHQEAIEKLAPWLTVEHPALKQHCDWAVKTSQRLQADWATLIKQRDDQLTLAQEYFSQARYAKATKELARIPEALQTDACRQLDGLATEYAAQLKELAAEIRELSSQGDYEALQVKLRRFLELKPGDEKAVQMLQRLLRRASKHAERDAGRTDEDSAQGDAEGYEDYQKYVARRRPARSTSTRSRGARLTLPSRRFLVTAGVAGVAGVAGLVAVFLIVKFQKGPEELTWLPDETATTIDSVQDTPEIPVALSVATPQPVRTTPEPNAALPAIDGEAPAPDSTSARLPKPELAMTPTVSKQSAVPLGSEIANSIDTKLPELLIAPFDEAVAKAAQKRCAQALGSQVEESNSIGMKLKLIPAGEFMMGSPVSEAYRNDDEQQHLVQIKKPFYLQATEVTQGQWRSVMNTQPWPVRSSVKEGTDFPTTHVSWDDAVAFCRKLSAKEGMAYRLPSEAEWEYACRAGSTSMYSFDGSAGSLKDYAWFNYNFRATGESYAHRTGLKRANGFGLDDMHGNVWEWCSDRYGEDYYETSPASDPRGPTGRGNRVYRGGSWYDSAKHCRSAIRSRGAPAHRDVHLGFRVVRSSDEPSSSVPSVATPVKPRTIPPATVIQSGPHAGEEQSDNRLKMKLVWCPPGKFTMGSPASESGRSSSEDQVQVTLTQGFWLGKYEVTQRQWRDVMGTEPWKAGQSSVKEGDQIAATFVRWYDIFGFCWKLTASERVSGRLPEGWEYTLPTEAQWEYACRAGTLTPYGFGDSAPGPYGWFRENTTDAGEPYAHEVGLKLPNGWNLHDMHGNVWEWCRDSYAPKLPGGTDPLVPFSSKNRVYRGGSWLNDARWFRSASRSSYVRAHRTNDVGFRVVLSSTK